MTPGDVYRSESGSSWREVIHDKSLDEWVLVNERREVITRGSKENISDYLAGKLNKTRHQKFTKVASAKWADSYDAGDAPTGLAEWLFYRFEEWGGQFPPDKQKHLMFSSLGTGLELNTDDPSTEYVTHRLAFELMQLRGLLREVKDKEWIGSMSLTAQNYLASLDHAISPLGEDGKQDLMFNLLGGHLRAAQALIRWCEAFGR